MADNGQYKELKTQLTTQLVFQSNSYPVNMTAALVFLKKIRSLKPNNNIGNRHGNGGNRNTADDANNKANAEVACIQAKKDQCFICGKISHDARGCHRMTPKI